MKKLMIALAAVALTAATQAATFSWTTSAVAYGLDAASVIDNGDYAAGTTQMKKNGTWSLILSLYEAGTDTLVGQSALTSVQFGRTNAKANTSVIVDTDAVKASTTYDYVLTITGTQTDLTARGKSGDYDYTGATLTTTLNGSVTTAASGASDLATGLPTTWTVSGITKTGGGGTVDTPEPTSGLLMLLGLAGLALRRKTA